MKHLHLILLGLVLLLTACGSGNGEGLYTRLDIDRELEPQSSVIDWANMTPEERRQYGRKGFVIDSPADFPDGKEFNMADLKHLDIDFKRYTLLVNYTLIPGYIKGHRFSWVYDNSENRYEFMSSFTIIRTDDPDSDLFTYYRSAVLVNKIRPGKEVVFSTSY